MIATHSSTVNLKRHATEPLEKLASAKRPRHNFVKSMTASLLMFKRPKTTEQQTKKPQEPKRQSSQLRQYEQTIRHQLNSLQKKRTSRHRMTELNNFIHKERNLITKDAKLNPKEKDWLIDNLTQLSKANRATDRDAILAKHKNALNAYRNDDRASPRLKLHLKLIANYIKPTATKPKTANKPIQTNINQLAEQSGRQHVQKFSHIQASQPGSIQSSRLNPLTKKASENLDKNNTGRALNNIDNIISKGQEANVVQEAIRTGFDAASLDNKSISKKRLADLHKSELSDVMKLAKDRIDTKVALGELNADAGKSAKAKIDNTLSEFSTPYDRKTNMTSVMGQLKGDATDAQNAKDAKTTLLKALDSTRVGKRDSSLRHVIMEARRTAIDLPNSKEVKDILLNFGEQSGVYKQEAEEILNKYAGSFTKAGKGIESLSREDRSYVFRLGKLHTPPGPHADKINAAIDQFAQNSGLKTH